MKYLIFFLLCFIQPICLPVPELTTYLYGQKTIGEIPAFIIGLIGVMLGIITMYLVSKKASDYIIKKFHYEAKIEKLADYPYIDHVYYNRGLCRYDLNDKEGIVLSVRTETSTRLYGILIPASLNALTV